MLTCVLILVLLIIFVASACASGRTGNPVNEQDDGRKSRHLSDAKHMSPAGARKANKPTKQKEEGHKGKSGYVGWERPDVDTLRDEPMVEVHATPAAAVDNSEPSECTLAIHTDIVATRPTQKEIVA